MYFVTNRRYDNSKKGFKKLTKKINHEGQNELRLLQLTDTPEEVTLLRDRLSKQKVRELKDRYHLPIDINDKYYASLEVACNVFEEATKSCKSVLIYVHGYNNDIHDIYKSAKAIEELYNVIVVVFTWPSNGGGNISGTLSYSEDKRDARGSADALNRFVNLVAKYHAMLTFATQEKLKARAIKKHPENLTQQRAYLSELTLRNCSTTINLTCHSMGNYVLKKALLSTTNSETKKLIFDNIILVAADANNKEHKTWVDTISVRKSIYILINENDFALSWARRKPGEEQKARLGHYLKRLDAKNPFYIDVTKEPGVGNEHSYFRGSAPKNNVKLKSFFTKVFSAENVLDDLKYIPGINTYRLR